MITPNTLEQIATPRTDAEVASLHVGYKGHFVKANFARQLERELSALQTAAKQPEGADWLLTKKYQMAFQALSIIGQAGQFNCAAIENCPAIARKAMQDAVDMGDTTELQAAPRPDEHRVREAVRRAILDHIDDIKDVSGMKVSLVGRLLDRITFALRPLLAGQVAGGAEDTRERVKRLELERFYEEGPDKNEEGDK